MIGNADQLAQATSNTNPATSYAEVPGNTTASIAASYDAKNNAESIQLEERGGAGGVAPHTTATNNNNSENNNTSAGPTPPANFNTAIPNNNTNARMNENSPIRPANANASKYLAMDSAVNSQQAVGLRQIIVGGLVFSVVTTIALLIQIIFGPPQVPFRIGIATPEPDCSAIGASMVHSGGNSVDAFIASSFCLSVVNPFSSGIGAGGFLLVRDHKRAKDHSYNCFLRSGSSLDPAAFVNRPSGKRSVAIPGEFKCLSTVYHKFARFYWKTLASPAVKLAKDGFKCSKLLADHLLQLDLDKDIRANPIMAEMYLQDDGKTLVTEGSIIKNKRLADTIENLISEEALLYDGGQIGNDIIQETDNAQFDVNDLKSYTVIESQPQQAKYNDYVLLTAPAPSNGPVVKFLVDLSAKLGVTVEEIKKAPFFNKMLQTGKMAYIMSAYLGDPQFSTDQAQTFAQKLTESIDYFKSPSNLTFPFAETGIDLSKNRDNMNSFVSVNDHTDLMVSYVGTLGSAWGSKVLTQDGFFLNDGLAMFSYGPDKLTSVQNSIDSNKQPRALIAPILTYNQKSRCISRYCISYGHHGQRNGQQGTTDDFGMTELNQVIVKLFTDFSLYENSIEGRRVQYANENRYCIERGFESGLAGEITTSQQQFIKTNSCQFHSINLIMKKDHVVYGKGDLFRSQDSVMVFNK